VNPPPIIDMLPLVDDEGDKQFVAATPDYTAPVVRAKITGLVCIQCGLPQEVCPIGPYAHRSRFASLSQEMANQMYADAYEASLKAMNSMMNAMMERTSNWNFYDEPQQDPVPSDPPPATAMIDQLGATRTMIADAAYKPPPLQTAPVAIKRLLDEVRNDAGGPAVAYDRARRRVHLLAVSGPAVRVRNPRGHQVPLLRASRRGRS
jgi:ferredoxin